MTNKTKKVEEVKKETKKSKKGYIILGIIILAAVILIPVIYSSLKEAEQKQEIEIKELKEKKIDLELEQNKEFRENGLSKKYYQLEDELTEVENKLRSKEAGSTIKFQFLPIIIVSITIMGVSIFLVIKIMVSSFNNMKLNPSAPSLFATRNRIIETSNRMLDKVNRELDAQEMAATKLKPLKCPSCKANLEHGAVKCEYCGTNLVRIKK